MSRKRLKAYKAGLFSEMLACGYLMLRGYRILRRRYKSPFGEIDILAARRNSLVAVEVKFRRQQDKGFGHVLESIQAKSRRRIEKALLHFIAQNPGYAASDLRFDVICFSPPFSFRHLDNAWQSPT